MKASLNLTLEEMFEIGMHFGHKKERTHARAKDFVYCVKDGISIINLEKTQESLQDAKAIFDKTVKEGKVILFVGTKLQARPLIKKVAETLGMPYMTTKWLGGTLTNFETILTSLKKLSNLQEKVSTEEFKSLSKKEKARIQNQINRMDEVMSGIKNLQELPDMLFIVDASREKIAIDEAGKLDIPIIAICDTNANPKVIDTPIFANDDAPKSIAAILSAVTGVEVKPEASSSEGEKNA